MIPLWAVKPLLYVAAIVAVCAGIWAGYSRVKSIGYDEAAAECRADELAANVARLERELEQARAAQDIGRLSRERLAIERGAINVQTQTSVEIVRAALSAEPVCPVPDRVRAEQQARIDQANATARGL